MSIKELRGLPRLEKFKIVEALWEDLSSEPDSIESPAWHGMELQQTLADHEAGKIESIGWNDAKRELTRSRE